MHKVSEFHLKEMGNTLGKEKSTFMMRKEENGSGPDWLQWKALARGRTRQVSWCETVQSLHQSLVKQFSLCLVDN